MNYQDIPKEELVLVSDQMIGILLINAGKDSAGEPINPEYFYKVEKHIPTGKLIIFNTGVNSRKNYIDRVGNKILKDSGKLN